MEMFVALPFKMKHSTDVIGVIILSIFEDDVKKGASEGRKPFYELW